MATLKTITPQLAAEHAHVNASHISLVEKFNAFADGQKQNRTLWFFLVLMVHGVLFLPLPAVLSYYFDAPFIMLAITMVCFFANLIANMAGAGIRTVLAFFGASILIHLAMTLIVIF
jgi:hypothetical protein